MTPKNKEVDAETAPDHEIISILDKKILTDFNLDKNLLRNWQTELSDVASDAELLGNATRHEIVLQFPPGPIYFTNQQRQAIEECFEKLDRLDSDVYFDFKLIVHEVISWASTALYTGRMQLYRCGMLDFLLTDFTKYACSLKEEPGEHEKVFCEAKVRLLSAFLELGCDAKHFKRLIFPLFAKTSQLSFTTKKLFLELLFAFLTKCPAQYSALLFNNFTARGVTIPINQDASVSKCFTISTWFKLNELPSISQNDDFMPLTLFSLANSADRESLVFQVQLLQGKFLVNIFNWAKKSRRQFPFNHTLKQGSSGNQGFTHFVLSYDNFQNLNLFIDGDYCESIPCSSISKGDIRWNKIYIGDPSELSEHEGFGANLFSKHELLIKDLSVMDLAMSFEWMSLFYLLGLGFDWSQKEFSESNIIGFLNSLSKRNYILMRYRAEKALRSKGQQTIHGSLRYAAANARDKSQSCSNDCLPNAGEIATLLAKSKIKTTNFLFDINDSLFIEFIDQSKSQEILYHRFDAFSSAIYCWGGSGLLLSLTEAVSKDDYREEIQRDYMFFETSRLLLSCLQIDWRLSKEFENVDGYWALILIIDYYKTNHNPNLIMRERKSSESPGNIVVNSHTARFQGSFLKMLLQYAITSENADSFISDCLAFRILILNFDLFCNTSDFPALRTHIVNLLATDEYKSHNFQELNKMKALRKLLQQIKVCILEEEDAEIIQELSRLLSIFIHFDVSAESIKHVSQFVIFALYNESATEFSQEAGLQALVALTNKLCGSTSSIKQLKKFSRSISIHWILLLLDYQSQKKPQAAKIVCCAICLFAKFLRVLGVNITQRFFKANRGLNVLSFFLQNWWNNDSVVSVLFLNSFGIDSDVYGSNPPSLPELTRNKSITASADKLVLPELITILNNMALTGIIELGQRQGRVPSTSSSPVKGISDGSSVNDQMTELSFDLMHLLNQMADMIEVGCSESVTLQELFTSKEWLEGAFEIVGHLKILRHSPHPTLQVRTNFEACVTRYIDVLSAIFISKLLDVNSLHAIMKPLNDITKKLIIDTIFPEVFEHINGFLGSSSFIFKESEFVRGATEILSIYHHEFLAQNYYASGKNLDAYLTCLVGIVETKDAKSSAVLQLGPILAEALILKLSRLSLVAFEEEDSDDDSEYSFATKFDEIVKFCLNKQGLFLQHSILSNAHLRSIVELLMGYYLKLSPQRQFELSAHVLNFFRSAFVIRENDLTAILEKLTQLSDYQNSIDVLSEFFSYLTTHSDEETVKYIQRFPTIKHIFNKNFHFRLSKLKTSEQINVVDMVQVVINSGGSSQIMNNTQLRGFEKDCHTLKSITITGEVLKYNRALQDTQENLQFYFASYSSLKLNVRRLLQESPRNKEDYVLDYIEGADRMRMLLVGEDQLPESEKLSYSVKVPIKQLNSTEIQDAAHFTSESILPAFGIQDEGLSHSYSPDFGMNEYEEIDEHGETKVERTSTNEDHNRKVIRSLYMGDQIQALFNISRVNGLDAVESLMILGFSHIYFIENFFHCADGNVVDIDQVPHDLRDPYLQFIKPPSVDKVSGKNYHIKTWSLESFACICKRKFLLRDIALELFFDDGASLLITCLSTRQRDDVYGKLSPYSSGSTLDRDLQVTLEVSSSSSQLAHANSSGFHLRSRLASAFTTSFTHSPSFSEITKKWKMGKMSNFYYLLSINTMAGRTFNDLTQYPIFPWVLADYENEELDLSNPGTFRDFSKPMGAQTAKRAGEYRERFEALASMNDDDAPPFHYGTHYSSAMIVTSYLIRLKPFVQSYLLLQGGKFDHADRLFNSVGKAWLSASQDNTTDVRELTPEFFYLPDFLVNKNHFEFGKLQNGTSSNDVELPKWAKGDPRIFIAKHREALESAHVSANLHHWIDLVFGYRQSGEEAIKALNVFHHSSYNGAINLDNIQDDTEKRAVIGMINNFGQTPLKLFNKPHPARIILNPAYLQLSLSEITRQKPLCTFESKLHLPIEKLELSAKSRKWIGRPSCTSSEDQILIRKPTPGQKKFGNGSLIINTTLFMNLHPTNITALLQIGNKLFMTGSDDGIIHVWKCSLQPHLTVSFHSVLRGHLSAITSILYSKTFKVGLSVDADGGIIQWDLTRFKFLRRIADSEPSDKSKILLAISNDTGNFCSIVSTKYNNTLTLYNLNGEILTEQSLKPGQIAAVSFAQVNDSLIESRKTEYLHSYWKDELIVLSYSNPQSTLQIHKLLVNDKGWSVSMLEEADISAHISGYVTTMSVYKKTEICEEEKLSRGRILLILGDSKGRVYIW
ncbi:hypothetical protein OY671_000233 [Metschnikowia pulcherrima]|nr:hypothetical protein OY671_000233 [Metschnikowia pulcherrima]